MIDVETPRSAKLDLVVSSCVMGVLARERSWEVRERAQRGPRGKVAARFD
jgi:hypothetical protein